MILRVLILTGSTRTHSTTNQIAGIAANLIRLWADCVVTDDLQEVPHFSEDLEGDVMPQSVATLKSSIESADAIVICTPEYNTSLPGVLKNAFDWASRPHGRGPFRGKTVSLIIHTPTQRGGFGVYSDLLRILTHMGNHVIAQPECRLWGMRPVGGGDTKPISPDGIEALECALETLRHRVLLNAKGIDAHVNA